MKINNIGIIGLGYVGLTFSIALAKKGFKVFGYEKNNKIFESLNKGKAQLNSYSRFDNGLEYFSNCFQFLQLIALQIFLLVLYI